MTLRVSLMRRSSPAVRAVLGDRSMMHVADERGADVVALARTVPDSPWLVLVQVPASDAYAPVRDVAVRMSVTAIALMAVCALGLGVLFAIDVRRAADGHTPGEDVEPPA